MTESNEPGQPGQENSPGDLNQSPADHVLANVPGAGTTAQREGVADEAFIRALYAEHGGALLRYALHLTGGDRQRAEDLVQETIVRAWRHPEALADRPARPWLFAVARNLAVDAYRARQARPPEVGQAVKIRPAKLGSNAVAIGAAHRAMKEAVGEGRKEEVRG